ncbi:hypothetical protein [Thermococcus sp. 18S1]|uniref:hypothetical protein n=1 Tax=Thermococcus sp. 18S1 TaxID=1638210 RepID=UPI001F0FE1C4|nr:hypothetical protein [Thermococcus sp. 18S1]
MKIMGQRVLVVIPAYNEELTIGSVVTLAKKYGDVLKLKGNIDSNFISIQRNKGV